MTTLVISTPWGKKDSTTGSSIGKPRQSHSWETFFITGRGLGYILYPSEYSKLQHALITSSVKVVMLRQDRKKRRAEARLIKIHPTPRLAKNGQRRYDIYFEDRKEIKPYTYLPKEKLKRNGVKVI